MTAPQLGTALSSLSVHARRRRKSAPHIDRGFVTDPYRGNREAALRFLNEALATEIVCLLRCRRHHFMARSLAANRIAEEFLVHADEELSHADLIAERIVRLGGEPDFAPDTLQGRSHSRYCAVTSIPDMVKEHLAAKHIAIENYRRLIEFIGEDDPTSRRMLEGILSVKEAHAEELLELLHGAS
ncbi:MAG: ferritin-like domain-containing protein [Steroidobacteraceae bacterium]